MCFQQPVRHKAFKRDTRGLQRKAVGRNCLLHERNVRVKTETTEEKQRVPWADDEDQLLSHGEARPP